MRLIKFFCILELFIIIHTFALTEDSLTWVYMSGAEPQMWEENGVAKGIEVEIVEYIMNKLNIEVKHEFYPWQRAQLMVKKGEADAMMTTPTSIRFEYAVFGKEHSVVNYWNVFCQKDKTDIIYDVKSFKKLEDLKGYKILDFIGNGWTAAFMKIEDGYEIHSIAQIGDIPLMLANGRQDLTINSSSIINWWAMKHEVTDKLVEVDIDWPWTRFHYVMMVSRKSPWVEKGLIRAMDEELKKMKANGVWQAILKKYKNPHGSGVPFKTYLGDDYSKKNNFYKDYDQYPIYKIVF